MKGNLFGDVGGNPRVNGIEYSAKGYMQQCVDRYLELAKKTDKDLKRAETPGMDDSSFMPNEFIEKGKLTVDAAKIVMKILYGARVSRWDLLQTVNYLAIRLTKWNVVCDKRLFRLICYIDTTRDWIMYPVIGDNLCDCHLVVYSDSDFASDTETSKSTSGGYVVLVGPNTWAPLVPVCKSQAAVSHSSHKAYHY